LRDSIGPNSRAAHVRAVEEDFRLVAGFGLVGPVAAPLPRSSLTEKPALHALERADSDSEPCRLVVAAVHAAMMTTQLADGQ
jgi:hypothetical protein